MPIKDYRRMGGWLVFFAIDAAFMAMQSLLSVVMSFSGGDWITGALSLLRLVAHIGVLVLLFTHRPAVRPVYLAAVGLYLVTLVVTVLRETDDGRGLLLILGGLSLAEVSAWAVYLYRSRRVAVWVKEDAFPEGAQIDALQAQMSAYYMQQNGMGTMPGAGYTQQGRPVQSGQGAGAMPFGQMADTALAQTPMQNGPICPYCGKPVREGGNFCGSCGHALR